MVGGKTLVGTSEGKSYYIIDEVGSLIPISIGYFFYYTSPMSSFRVIEVLGMFRKIISETSTACCISNVQVQSSDYAFI